MSDPTDGPAIATPVGAALQLLGDRWTLLLVRDAFVEGYRRFHEWRGALGISDAVLSSRLGNLVDGGVLHRHEHDARHVEYRLTAMGLDLWQILISVWAWERRWVEAARVTHPDLRHLRCGELTVPVLVCSACRRPTTARDTTAEIGRGGQDFVRSGLKRRRRSSKAGEPTGTAMMFPETIAVFGDNTAAGIVALAFLGFRRFVDFERELGVSPTSVNHRLRELVHHGVLRQLPDSTYRLTPKGMDFFPVTMSLVDWADQWLGNPTAPTVSVTHRACGKRFRPALACDRCETVIERRDVRFDREPGAEQEIARAL